MNGTVADMSAAAELAAAVAAELGAGWSGVVDPGNDSHGMLRGPDGERVHVQLGSSYTYHLPAGRVRFSAYLPDDLRDVGTSSYHHDITASREKPAATLARDVTRRLLPAYQSWMRSARAAAERRRALLRERDQIIEAAVAELAALGEVQRWDSSRSYSSSPDLDSLAVGSYGGPVHVRGKVNTRYPSQIDPDRNSLARLEVNIHRELLPRLARALAALAAPEPAGCNHDAAALQGADALVCECGALVYGGRAYWPEPQPEPADEPRQVWVVVRHDTGGLEAFADQRRAEQYAFYAREYAGTVSAAELVPLTVMNDSAAGQFLIDLGEEAGGQRAPEAAS